MGSTRWVYPSCVSVGLLAPLKVNLSYSTSVLSVQLAKVAQTCFAEKLTIYFFFRELTGRKKACFQVSSCLFWCCVLSQVLLFPVSSSVYTLLVHQCSPIACPSLLDWRVGSLFTIHPRNPFLLFRLWQRRSRLTASGLSVGFPPGAFLCRACMFFLSLHQFSPGALGSYHSRQTCASGYLVTLNRASANLFFFFLSV